MTPDANAGSGAADTQSQGNPDATAAAAAAQGSQGNEGKTWLDGLSEGNRKLADTKGWKAPGDIDKALTSYSELEGLVGKSLQVPGEKATPEEWNTFYSKAGRPETADKYEFKKPDGLPADLPYDDNMATASKSWMHDAGLSQRQAQVVHDHFARFMGEQQTAAMKKIAGDVEAAHDALVKEWGPQDSEGFKSNLSLAGRALTKLGLADVLKARGVLLNDGAITDAQVAKAFAAVGDAMFKEDGLDPNASQGGVNPFKRVDGSIASPSAISALIKSDPEKAKRLCREAGERWEDWMPSNPL